jgi:hypothetical protein
LAWFPRSSFPAICHLCHSLSSAPPYPPMSSGLQAGWWCCDMPVAAAHGSGSCCCNSTHCHPVSRGSQQQCRGILFSGWAMS